MVIVLSFFKKSFCGGIMPIFAATGSKIIAAILSPYFLNNFSTEAMSLYLAKSVLSVNALGTPGLLGVPKVVAPEPA